MKVVKLMMIVNGTMRNVIKRMVFADQGALTMKIVTAYHAILIRECVIQVRFYLIAKIHFNNY